MSRKNKRKAKARPGIQASPRPLQQPANATHEASPVEAGPAPLGQPVAAAASAPARTFAPTSTAPAKVTGPRRPTPTTAPGQLIDIESRVPYFSSDLRRILITAGAMILVIIAASFVLH